MLIEIKPPGYTMNQFIQKIKSMNNIKKLCFCGRLDPMARGEVLLLVNEECKQMDKYINTYKVYTFEIVFGLQTITDDPLGLIESIDVFKPTEFEKIYIKLLNELKEYNKKSFSQKFHPYSSKKVNGIPLWYYKKNNIQVTLPEHNVEVLDVNTIPLVKYNFNLWKQLIIEQIKTVDTLRDFNQETIIKQWTYMNLSNLYALPVTVYVSSGFYIRQFVRDLSDKIQYPLMAYDINRTNIIL